MKYKILIPLFLLAVFMLVAIYSIVMSDNKGVYIPSPSPQIRHEEIPVRLKIPSLNVDTKIESIGQTANGAMDVPKDVNNVGWYNLGYLPGETGNAVIAGHFDDTNGDPAVFHKLSTIKLGDEIIVEVSKHESKAFKVTDIQTYKYNDFPVEEVFGSWNIPRLNLITCGGAWDEENNVYVDRIVIYSELK